MRFLALALLLAPALIAQKIEGAPVSAPGKDHVAFVNEPASVAANQQAIVPLTFNIDSGFHINSHDPREKNLIATRLVVLEDKTRLIKTVDFPKGHDYSFAASPNDKLDVYTGRFTLTVHVQAPAGMHTLHAILRYQACDTASCYPPRSLPFDISFNAK